VLVTANVVVALLLVGSGLVYGYVRYRIDGIRTGSSAGLSSTPSNNRADQSQAAAGLAPENILLIGNETRLGQVDVHFGNPNLLTGSLSDVIMLVHLDPKARTAALLSIPRDVWAPMPAGSQVGPYEKIDAALNDGSYGPNNLVKAISEDFGIPIQHYVEVDFDGFLQTVNALGGIRMDFPELLYDAVSDLDITHTGCQLLGGQQALALVRSRHLQYDPPGVSPTDKAAWPYDPESNLARIVRDHEVLEVLVKTAESEGLTNPIKLNDFLGAILSQLTIDPGLKAQLIPLAERYHDLNPASAPSTTIPVTGVNNYSYGGAYLGDVEFADQPADDNIIRKWDPGALPVPVAPSSVSVENATSSPTLAASTGSALAADGFHVSSESDTSSSASPEPTLVRYHPGQIAMGFDVFSHLAGMIMLQPDAAVPAGTVTVVAGTTFRVDPPPGTTTTPAAVSAPTPGGQAPSTSATNLTPYDPRPCTN